VIFYYCFPEEKRKIKITDSLGRAGRADKERMSPSMSMTSWSAWSSTWDG